MERKLKLTISILVSNRKDTVPKCLESLRPLLEQVDSELIITDTGCDEELVEYMKKYTDNIVKFQWCNDFAKARNLGLKMARGQWFMFIDDDEWFEDVSEMITFFNSNECDKYESANYIVRNYHNMDGKYYTEGVVGRMFRIHNDLEFIGKVHEHIENKEGETKQFLCYAHHYGYVFDSEEKSRAHFERNSRLLRDEIEENPSIARNYAHIYQEYKMVDKPDTVLEYVTKALKDVDETVRINKVNMCSTYVAALWAYSAKKDYQSVIEKGEEFLDKKPVTFLTRALMNTYMAEAYKKMERYHKSIESVDAYVKSYDAYIEDKRWYYKEVGPMINDVYGDNRLGMTLNMGIHSAIELNKVDKAMEYILVYNWSEHIYMPEYDCLSSLVDMLSKISEDESMMYARIIERALGKIFTHIECSRIFLGRLAELKNENTDGYLRVCGLMSRVAGQPAYKNFATLIQVAKSSDDAKLINVYENIIADELYLLMMEKEFYEVAFARKIPIGRMITSLDEAQWKERLRAWASVVRNKEIISTKKYMDKILISDSVHMNMFEQQIIAILENRRK